MARVLALCIAFAIGSCAWASDDDGQRPYRFVVQADKGTINGLIRVDGVTRLVAGAASPFEFSCERASVISGYFEPGAPAARLELVVFDPEYKRGKRKSLFLPNAPQFRFAWGQPGTAPRCADWAVEGDETCPATVPTAREFKLELERLRAEGTPTAQP